MTNEHLHIPQFCQYCGKRIPSSEYANADALSQVCDDCHRIMLTSTSVFHSTPESSLSFLAGEAQYQYGILKENYSIDSIVSPSFAEQTSVSLSLEKTGDLSTAFQDVGKIQSTFITNTDSCSITSYLGAISAADTTLKISGSFSALASGDQYITQITDPSYLGWLKTPSVDTGDISINATSHLTGVLGTSVAATNSLLTFDTKKFYGIADDQIELARLSVSSLDALATGYSDLWSDLVVDPSVLLNSSAVVVERPPIELFQAGTLANAIAPIDTTLTPPDTLVPEIIKISTDVRKKIHALGQSYLDMYDGAAEAIFRRSKDSQRQGCASLRELFTHTIHSLAPDKSALEYLNKLDNPEEYIHKGHPNRRGRLKYINRNIDNPAFEEFLERDIDAALAYFDLLQQGVHSLDTPYSDEQAQAIIHRGEGLISFMIEIATTD